MASDNLDSAKNIRPETWDYWTVTPNVDVGTIVTTALKIKRVIIWGIFRNPRRDHIVSRKDLIVCF